MKFREYLKHASGLQGLSELTSRTWAVVVEIRECIGVSNENGAGKTKLCSLSNESAAGTGGKGSLCLSSPFSSITVHRTLLLAYTVQ